MAGEEGDEEVADEGGDEASGGLLAAPAHRDEHNREYSKNSMKTRARGKRYVKKSQRGGDGRNGREQHLSAIAIPKPKDVVPGSSDMRSLSHGIYEVETPTYDMEEDIMMQSNNDVRRLITELQENSEIKINENEA